MLTVYECIGTNALFDIGGTPEGSLPQLSYALGTFQNFLNSVGLVAPNPSTYAAATLNAALVKHVMVPYPAALVPLSASVAQGDTALINLINANTGQFAFLGFSQGALVASNVYDQIRTGSLTARNSDFLGGVVMGNPRRQSGHTFPLCSDPGGGGALGPGSNLAGSETRWFDFANSGDLVCTTDPTTIAGAALVAVTNLMYGGWGGTQAELQNLLTNPIWTVIDTFNAIIDLLLDLASGPHQTYGTTTPLAPADTRTCSQIGFDYLHSLALGWNAATVAPIATAVTGAKATVQVAVPTLTGTYTYSVQQFDVTSSTLSTATLTGSPVVAGGNVTVTVTGLTVGHNYKFAVKLGTTYTSPTVTPLSTASNQITAIT